MKCKNGDTFEKKNDIFHLSMRMRSFARPVSWTIKALTSRELHANFLTNGIPIDDPALYRELVGCLVYLTMS